MKAFVIFLTVAAVCYIVNKKFKSGIVTAVMVASIALAVTALGFMVAGFFIDPEVIVESTAAAIFGEDSIFVDLCLRFAGFER